MKNQTNQKSFDANFTAGGLLHIEFNSIVSLLTQDNFEELINQDVIDNKYLGISRENSRKRIATEILRRVVNTGSEFWVNFEQWTENERRLALFYLCLKTYPIVMDLHLEVGMKRYATGDDLSAFVVKMRLDELVSTIDEISNWTDSTLDKINSQYRKALKDCNLLQDNRLQPPFEISDNFWYYFESIGENWFKKLCFL